MSTAPNYTPGTSFADDETNNVAGRSLVKTDRLDTELANVSSAVNGINQNLQSIQRDDGKLKDETVEPYALAEQTKALIAVSGCTPRGIWQPNTDYKFKEVVQYINVAQICLQPHNSGTTFVQELWLPISGDGTSAANAAAASAAAAAASSSASSALSAENNAQNHSNSSSISASNAYISQTNAQNYSTSASLSATSAAGSAASAQSSAAAINSLPLVAVNGATKAIRQNSSDEGGQVEFAKANDGATAWYLDVYGTGNDPVFRLLNKNLNNSGIASVASYVDNTNTFWQAIPGGSVLLPNYPCRAWVNFNGSGVPAIRASGNVSSITKNGTGDYTINFYAAFPDVNYGANVTAGNTGASAVGNANSAWAAIYGLSSLRVGVSDNNTDSNQDAANINVSIFR